MAGMIPVTLGGAAFQMRPAYGSMRDIEARTGMTVSELLELVAAQRLKIDEAVAIIWCGCQAAGENFDSLEAVGETVFDARLTSPELRKSLSLFLLSCLWAPAAAKKKFDEEIAPLLATQEIG